MSNDRGKAEYSSMDFGGSFEIETKGCSIDKGKKHYSELEDSLVVKGINLHPLVGAMKKIDNEDKIKQHAIRSTGDAIKKFKESRRNAYTDTLPDVTGKPKPGTLMAERQKKKDIFTKLRPEGQGLRAPQKVEKPMSIDIGNKRPGAYDQPLLKGRRPNSFDQKVKELDDSMIVVKETAKEHFVKRLTTMTPGKSGFFNTRMVNQFNNQIRSDIKDQAGKTALDEVVKQRRGQIAGADRAVKNAIPKANAYPGDITEKRKVRLLDRVAKRKEELGKMLKPEPTPVAGSMIDDAKYDMALNRQKIDKERDKIIQNRRAQFTRIKEYDDSLIVKGADTNNSRTFFKKKLGDPSAQDLYLKEDKYIDAVDKVNNKQGMEFKVRRKPQVKDVLNKLDDKVSDVTINSYNAEKLISGKADPFDKPVYFNGRRITQDTANIAGCKNCKDKITDIILDKGKKKAKNLLKVIKEYDGISGDMINKAFEE